MQRETTRRSLLSVGAIGLLVGVAGCLGGSDDTTSDTGDTETDETPSTDGADGSTDERAETRDSLEGGVTSHGITVLEPGYYHWEIYQDGLEEPDSRRIAIAEADAEITALVEWTVGESAFVDEISGAANQVGQELFTSQGSGSFWFVDAYEHLWDDTAETLPIGDSAMESTQEELQYTVTGTETIQGLECHTLESRDMTADVVRFEGAISLATGIIGSYTMYGENGAVVSDQQLTERSSTIPDDLAADL